VVEDWDVGPVTELVTRLLGEERAGQLELVALRYDGVEEFVIERADQWVRVSATTDSALLAGVNTYLSSVAGVNVSWNGDSLDRLPRTLPLPSSAIRQTASLTHRFALNDTDDAYTGPYRDWTAWEREIDVLALHGINRVFVPVGAEAVYLETFTRLGYTENELLRWIPLPSHQPWWLLQNMSGFPSAMSAELVRRRAELGARLVRRLRELGITPVLPGYFGTVPPGFAERAPDARTVAQGDWVGFDRPDWLDPTCPAFERVAAAFYASSARLFGRTDQYKMDLLHEGGQAGDTPVGPASKAVQDALDQANPGATWVFLGWQDNPPADVLAGVDRSRVLIVDGLSDRYAGWNRNETWPDTTYAFGAIWNFGGHTTVGANVRVWEERFWAWRAEAGSTLDGVAVMPEASDNNPAAFDYLTGLAWRDRRVDPDAWFADWAHRRYGGRDRGAGRAWQVLARTAYAMPADDWSEAPDSLFAAEPSLTATTAATWSPHVLRYDAEDFAAALPALLDVEPSLRGTSAYRYDLVDVARQVVANRSRALLPQLRAAYERGDRPELDRLAGIWMEHLELLERITATNRQTMLGPWLADARAWAETEEGADALERGMRILLTAWGGRGGYDAGLADYANREWAGLISTYYAPRWKAYLGELSAALTERREPRTVDWYRRAVEWAAVAAPLPTTPSGDPHAIATDVERVLRAHPVHWTDR
jgi:alpha-N-acetylglucosaminidase